MSSYEILKLAEDLALTVPEFTEWLEARGYAKEAIEKLTAEYQKFYDPATG